MDADLLNTLTMLGPDIRKELEARQTYPVEAATVFAGACRDAYWDHKDINRFVTIARAGIRYNRLMAERFTDADPRLAATLLSSVKQLAYNLGSFTWPGWDEPGIELSEAHLHIGLEAAGTNLRMAYDLKKGDLPMSRGHWLVGAHHMVGKQWDAARQSFAEAELYAERAGAGAEALMAAGYRALVDHLAASDESLHIIRLATIGTELAALEGGAEFKVQLETARAVFER